MAGKSKKKSKAGDHLKGERSSFVRFDKSKLMFYRNVDGERDYSVNKTEVSGAQAKASARRPLAIRILTDWWSNKGERQVKLFKGTKTETQVHWKVADFNTLFRLNGDLIVLNKAGDTNVEESLNNLAEVIKIINESLKDNPNHKALMIQCPNWVCETSGRRWVSPKVKSQAQTLDQKIDNAADALLALFPLNKK
jgi:hypothetical protein